MHLIVLFLALIISSEVFAKVRILTFHYNQAEFIKLQCRCLKKFMRDDYELIVFNDASTPENEAAIRDACQECGVKHVRYEQDWHLTAPLNEELKTALQSPDIKFSSHLSILIDKIASQPSVRHSHVIQYALDTHGYNHDDAVVIMDGDAFFVREISIKDRLKSVDIFGMGRRDLLDPSIQYFWSPFIAFNPAALPNLKDLKFSVSIIDHTLHDTGAASHHYLAANPTVRYTKTLPIPSSKLRRQPVKELKKLGYTSKERWLIKALPKHRNVEFNIENCVLHFRAVSFALKDHATRVSFLEEYMEKILNAK
jgi:hypothetical protein